MNSKYGRKINSKHCFLLSSGKAALTIILLALKKIYPDRDQVIIPAFTCYSVPAAVKRAGLQIQLCDLAPSSLDLDQEQLKKIIAKDKQEKKILCVLPTHLFGCPADVTGIRSIVGPEMPIIEDAAQAMGETCCSRKLGTLGDIGFFSLGRGKALSTMEGGIIITDRDDLAQVINSSIDSLTGFSVPDTLKLFLITVVTAVLQYPAIFWLPKAIPFLRLGETLYEPDFPLRRFSSFHAKLAENWQKRLSKHKMARVNNIKFWQKKTPEGFSLLCPKAAIGMVRQPMMVQSRKGRDDIIRHSARQGLGIMPAYPTSINKIPELALEFFAQDYPQAEKLSNRLVTLPVHEYINNRDKEQILSLLNNQMNRVGRRHNMNSHPAT